MSCMMSKDCTTLFHLPDYRGMMASYTKSRFSACTILLNKFSPNQTKYILQCHFIMITPSRMFVLFGFNKV